MTTDDLHPTRWYRAIGADGETLAETSDVEDFEDLGLVGQAGVTIQRLYESRAYERSAWRKEDPDAV